MRLFILILYPVLLKMPRKKFADLVFYLIILISYHLLAHTFISQFSQFILSRRPLFSYLFVFPYLEILIVLLILWRSFPPKPVKIEKLFGIQNSTMLQSLSSNK